MATSLTYTRKGALAALNTLNPVDAARVIRDYAALKYVGLDGGCEILDACETLIDELCPADPETRFVSSDYSYEVRAGLHSECR